MRVHLERGAQVEFLADLTYQTDSGAVVEQEIFDRVFEAIDAADRFVVIDMFLFNGEHGGDRREVELDRRDEAREREHREGDDGVVSFESAQLPGVDSQIVVRSGHSAQSHPETMREVGRILLEDLSERGVVSESAP